MGDISPNFSRSEFACQCGCGFDTVDVDLIASLEFIRDYYGKPVYINSGCRCPEHNRFIGGADNSQHLYGRAADFVVDGIHADEVAELLLDAYDGEFGIGRYVGRTHLDTRSDGPARWDMR